MVLGNLLHSSVLLITDLAANYPNISLKKIRQDKEKDNLLVDIRYKSGKFVAFIMNVSKQYFFKVFKNEVECISSDLNTKTHPFTFNGD